MLPTGKEAWPYRAVQLYQTCRKNIRIPSELEICRRIGSLSGKQSTGTFFLFPTSICHDASCISQTRNTNGVGLLDQTSERATLFTHTPFVTADKHVDPSHYPPPPPHEILAIIAPPQLMKPSLERAFLAKGEAHSLVCDLVKECVAQGLPTECTVVEVDGVNVRRAEELAAALGASCRVRPYFPQ